MTVLATGRKTGVGIKSVQRGSLYISAMTTVVTIAPVDPNKAELRLLSSSYYSSTSTTAGGSITLRLTSPTTLEVMNSGSVYQTVSWELTESY